MFCLKVLRLRMLVFVVRVVLRQGWVWSIDRIKMTERNRSTRRTTSPNFTLFTSHPTSTGPGSETGLRSGRLANDCLSHGTAFWRPKCIYVISACVRSDSVPHRKSLLLHFQDQPVIAVQGDNNPWLRESHATHKHTHTLETKWRSCEMLKKVTNEERV